MGLFQSAGAVGLDIDTGVIRVVELKGKAHSATLAAAGKIELPEHAVIEGVVNDIDTVADALKELWKRAHISRREIILGISNQGVLMRMASFPKILENKLAQVLRYQAGDYFPIPLDEMVLDHAVVGEATGDNEENEPELEVLLVAARRELLEYSLSAAAAASLRPLVVDPSPLALLRTLEQEQLKGTVVLLDIANGLTNLLLIEKGIPRFARVIPHSLLTLARKTETAITEITETALRIAAAAEDGQAAVNGTEFAGEWKMILANEIRSSINYYMARRYTSAVDLVILSGHGSRLVGLSEFLQEELEVPLDFIRPLQKISGSTQVEGVDLIREEPDFAVGIGLALRGLEA